MENMLGSGWRTGEGELRGGHLCTGSGVSSAEMEKLKVGVSVWGADEAFLSPPEYGSSLAASVESEESCEDSEDYISGLAEEIAQSMLQEDEEASMKSAPWVSKPAWSGHQMASSPTSPQSTLAGMGGYNWDARSPGGNMGSSGVSSPPTPQEGDAIDVLYAELLRVKLEDQVKLANQQQVLSRQQQIIQRPTALATSNGLPSDNHFPLDKFSPFKSNKYARSKGGGQELENYQAGGGSKQVWGSGPFSSSKGIISNKRKEEGVQQQQYHQFSLFASNMESNSMMSIRSFMGNSSTRKQEEGGMRAVFLGSTASRECGGTGVFLPRRPQDSKRKPDFSSLNSQWWRNPQVASRRSKPKDEISSCYFRTSHPTTLQEVAPDISLPSEWTY